MTVGGVVDTLLPPKERRFCDRAGAFGFQPVPQAHQSPQVQTDAQLLLKNLCLHDEADRLKVSKSKNAIQKGHLKMMARSTYHPTTSKLHTRELNMLILMINFYSIFNYLSTV